jgi:hypothetical protein
MRIANRAFRFVLTIGIVSLFADMTYEGARGITGPLLGSLGASATAIRLIVGFAELIGYGLRSVSGYFADRTHQYWAFIFVGYATNLLAVPALDRLLGSAATRRLAGFHFGEAIFQSALNQGGTLTRRSKNFRFSFRFYRQYFASCLFREPYSPLFSARLCLSSVVMQAKQRLRRPQRISRKSESDISASPVRHQFFVQSRMVSSKRRDWMSNWLNANGRNIRMCWHWAASILRII